MVTVTVTRTASPDSPSLRWGLRQRPRARLRQLTLASAYRRPEPRLPAVALALALTAATDPDLGRDQLRVVDLFCGIGGWSEGSRQAGHRVVLAVDCHRRHLAIHRRNHPRCTQLLLRLGPETEEALVRRIRAVVPAGARWHLHGSPCQPLCPTRAIQARDHDAGKGMDIVLWFLRLVHRLEPTTWTMEEVSTQQLTGALRMLQALRPDRVAFAPTVSMQEYGVPQTRRRCIAGSPALIERLLTDASLREPAPPLGAVLTPPEGAVLCRASTGQEPNPEFTTRHPDGTYTNPTIRRCIRTVHDVAWTCCAEHPHAWCRADFTRVRTFTVREQAALQTFPSSYVVPNVRSVGDAVPPLFARKVMSGA